MSDISEEEKELAKAEYEALTKEQPVQTPEQAAFQAMMNKLSGALDAVLNPDGKKKMGFSLFVFNSEIKEMNVTYVSNCKREDVITVMDSFVDNNKKNRLKRLAKVTQLRRMK